VRIGLRNGAAPFLPSQVTLKKSLPRNLFPTQTYPHPPNLGFHRPQVTKDFWKGLFPSFVPFLFCVPAVAAGGWFKARTNTARTTVPQPTTAALSTKRCRPLTMAACGVDAGGCRARIPTIIDTNMHNRTGSAENISCRPPFLFLLSCFNLAKIARPLSETKLDFFVANMQP